MYIQKLKSAVVEALKTTFADNAYPEEDFRDTTVSIEFPTEEQHFPSVWVDWEPTGEVTSAGIGHVEYVDAGGDTFQPVYRWRFQGYVTFTAVAMASWERDRLVDELLRILALGDAHPSTAAFRSSIQSNDFLAMNFSFGQVAQRGFAASPGTPWGSADVVYEATLAIECVGEFVSEVNEENTLAKITAITVTPYTQSEGDPTAPDGWS